MSRQHLIAVIAAAALLIGVLVSGYAAETSPTVDPAVHDRAVRLEIKPLPDGVGRVYLHPDGADGHLFELVKTDGTSEWLDANEFADRLYLDQGGKSWQFRLLNISSPIGFAWVLVGFLGQVLFTGRMLLQWLVSERARRSVVPVGFWWMSLAGASMLLVYFSWRRDIVGILGQATGWSIYVRNLWLIYRPRV